jgi:hypothetical protein
MAEVSDLDARHTVDRFAVELERIDDE